MRKLWHSVTCMRMHSTDTIIQTHKHIQLAAQQMEAIHVLEKGASTLTDLNKHLIIQLQEANGILDTV